MLPIITLETNNDMIAVTYTYIYIYIYIAITIMRGHHNSIAHIHLGRPHAIDI